LRWNLKQKRLELIPDLGAKEHRLLITWGLGGSGRDRYECEVALAMFIKQCGGPLQSKQWESNGIRTLNDELWRTANGVWGEHPVLSEENAPAGGRILSAVGAE
jgi:hypothetical protein